MNSKIKVLIVDDNPDDVYLIEQLLKDIIAIQFEFLHEKSLGSALEHLEKEKVDCIILDLNLPDSQGTDTLKSVVNNFPELPVIVLTIIDDEDIATKSLQDGAQDYLIKGKINGEIISRSIRYAIERKKVDNILRHNEKKYRNIVDTILEGLWTVDITGKTTYVNKQLAEMLNYTQEEILNQPFFNFVDKNLRNEAKQFFERRRQGIKERYDFCFNKKDGSPVWVIVSASPIFDNKGKFAGATGLLTDITEHKLTEDSLQKSYQEWYFTFNAISDTICIIDTEGKIIRCNNAAEKLFKKPVDRLIGDTCWNILNCPPERLEKCPIRQMLKAHKRETLVIQIRDKWFYSTVDPITDNSNNVIGGVHIISDITKYKLAQDKLRENEEKFQTIVENTQDIIARFDKECRYLYINSAISRYTDIKLEDFIGKKHIELGYPEEKAKLLDQTIKEVFNTGKPKITRLEIYSNKKRDKIYFDWHIFPEFDEKGDVKSAVTILSDITERKSIEDALRDSEALYRTIIEYSNDMIWTLDSEGNFTFLNKRLERISRYKLEEQKGKNFAPLIIEQDLPKVLDAFHSTLNGQPNQYEATFINKYNRHITISVATAPIYSKGKIVGTVSFGRDITEQKRTEAKIKKTAKELERSNKELEQFAYIASHDLQEPLRTISSFTELLANNYKNKLGLEADEFINYIMTGTRRMRQMIDDLLTLSRIETRGKEFAPTNVKNVLDQVLANLRSLIDRNNAIVTIGDMPTVDADETQLMQLFQNLIDNAIKFRKKDVAPQVNVRVSAKQENNEWIFSVQDNGIGIDPKHFSKLFVIFQRLHSRDEYPGTGIGLAMCKKIVTRHGGRIWIESKLGEGSIFYFSIPIKRGENGNNDK